VCDGIIIRCVHEYRDEWRFIELSVDEYVDCGVAPAPAAAAAAAAALSRAAAPSSAPRSVLDALASLLAAHANASASSSAAADRGGRPSGARAAAAVDRGRRGAAARLADAHSVRQLCARREVYGAEAAADAALMADRSQLELEKYVSSFLSQVSSILVVAFGRGRGGRPAVDSDDARAFDEGCWSAGGGKGGAPSRHWPSIFYHASCSREAQPTERLATDRHHTARPRRRAIPSASCRTRPISSRLTSSGVQHEKEQSSRAMHGKE